MSVKKSLTTTTKVLRAILADWVERVWKSVAYPVWGIGFLLALVVTFLVIYHHFLWLALLAAILSTLFVASLILLAAFGLIRLANSTETPAQRHLTGSIVDKLTLVAETRNTPKPLLALRVVFDAATKRTGLVRELLVSAVGAKEEIIALGREFGGEVAISPSPEVIPAEPEVGMDG